MTQHLLGRILIGVLCIITAAPSAAQDECRVKFEHLNELAALDQAIRRGYDTSKIDVSANDSIEALSRSNTAELSQIIKKCGWPNPPRGEASHSAWVIVQHSDHDIAFQYEVLQLLRQKALDGTFDKLSYAKLTDRVAINSGKKQTYGTQLTVSGGKVTLPANEIVSEEAVERNRAELGIESLKDYLARARRQVAEDSKKATINDASRSHSK